MSNRMIVDAHRDIAYDALVFERDYRLSAAEARARDASSGSLARFGAATTGLPDALAGRIGVTFATLFVEPASFVPWGNLDTLLHPPNPIVYHTPQEAHDQALAQLQYYFELEAAGVVCIIRTQSDLDRVLATWTNGAAGQQGLVILMEGADPILEPAQFGDWYGRGVRICGTSWSRTRYAGGTNAPGGLTDIGRALLKEMSDYNALLDLSHMSEAACMESLHTYDGQIIASHALPRHFSDTDRHLSDAAIRRLAARDGVLGLVLINALWNESNAPVSLAQVVEVIDYVCQMVGSAAHVGIGTDWVAAIGTNDVPTELDTLADLPLLAHALTARGYAQSDVNAIMGGNMLRKLRQTLPDR